jgi:hypothetical protein
MPIITSFASLSKNGFTSSGSIIPQIDWLGVFDTKIDGIIGTTGTVKTVSNQPYIFGNGQVPSIARPYYSDLNVSTGAATTYKLFADVAYSSTQTDLNDIVIDGSGNKHILFGSITSTGIVLAKYDSSGNFVIGKTITSGGGLGNSVKMAVDASNNIYILSMTGASGVFITKVDSTAYTVTWSKFYDFGGGYSFNASNTAGKLLIDSSNNIYLVAHTSASSGANFVVKINNSGTVIWTRGSTYTTISSTLKCCLDGSDNFYMLLTKNTPSIVNILAKLDSSGTKIYEYTLSTTAIMYLYMDLNNVGSLVLSDSASNSTTTPINMLTIGSISTTPAVTYASSFTTTTDQMQVNSLACNTYGTYLGIDFESNPSSPPSKTTMAVLKLPANLNITGTSSWNFTVTTDNSTNYTYNGSITFAAGTSSTLSSTTAITFTTSAPTVTSISTSTSNTTPGSNATVPFTYSTNIV